MGQVAGGNAWYKNPSPGKPSQANLGCMSFYEVCYFSLACNTAVERDFHALGISLLSKNENEYSKKELK